MTDCLLPPVCSHADKLTDTHTHTHTHTRTHTRTHTQPHTIIIGGDQTPQRWTIVHCVCVCVCARARVVCGLREGTRARSRIPFVSGRALAHNLSCVRARARSVMGSRTCIRAAHSRAHSHLGEGSSAAIREVVGFQVEHRQRRVRAQTSRQRRSRVVVEVARVEVEVSERGVGFQSSRQRRAPGVADGVRLRRNSET